jgi:hypothetical protein
MTDPQNTGSAPLHPATQQILRHFAFDHLPEHLGSVSAEAYALAMSMAHRLPSGPEVTAGLRKLLEAKDCFVRAALDKPEAAGG